MNVEATFLTDRNAARPTAWDEVTMPFSSGSMEVIVATDGTAVVAIRFALPGADRSWLGRAARDPEHPVLVAAAAQLGAYARGDQQVFELPLRVAGTPFQLSVWSALLEIPYGETSTYAKVAATIGRPTSIRAVGAAIGANPVCIVVPCHRVIGTNGTLTGFAGGLKNKALLLTQEGTLAQ